MYIAKNKLTTTVMFPQLRIVLHSVVLSTIRFYNSITLVCSPTILTDTTSYS